MPSKQDTCRCRLKKELEEKCPEVAEPSEKVDPHQKLCDIKVKGAPGTKVESMKVTVFVHYITMLILLSYVVLLFDS